MDLAKSRFKIGNMDFIHVGEGKFFPALTARWDARLQRLKQDAASSAEAAQNAVRQRNELTERLIKLQAEFKFTQEKLALTLKDAKASEAALVRRGMRVDNPAFSELAAAVNNLEHAVAQESLTCDGVEVQTFSVTDPMGVGSSTPRDAWRVTETGKTGVHNARFHLGELGGHREMKLSCLLRYGGRRYLTIWIRDEHSAGSTLLLDLQEASIRHVVHEGSIGQPIVAFLEPIYTGWVAFYVHYMFTQDAADPTISLVLREASHNAHSYTGSGDRSVDVYAMSVKAFSAISEEESVDVDE